MTFRVLRHADLSSTNDTALDLARAGDPGGVWVVAASQSGGRGRQGRVWRSPPGNLYASLLLVDPAPIRRAPELGFVAGVALAEALRLLAKGDDRLCIKWPNDILFEDAKLSGILLESAALANGRFACVIGFGVNCASHPPDTPYRATHLAEIGVPLATPEIVLEALSESFARIFALWAAGTGFDEVRARWLGLAAGLGGEIRISRPPQNLVGRFRTIDATGRLILDRPEGPLAIEAGDVFFIAPPKMTLAPEDGTS